MNVLLYIFLTIVGIALVSVLVVWVQKKNKKFTSRSHVVAGNERFILQTILTAHERIVLFVERNFPPRLIDTLFDPQLSRTEMQVLLVETIKREFDHNVTQQLYVSAQVWAAVVLYKDKLILSLNVLSDADKQADSRQYAKSVVEWFAQTQNQQYYKHLLDAIQFDAKQVLKFA